MDAVNLRHGRWTPKLVRLVHEAGMKAFAWDVQNRVMRRYVLMLGVDGFYSDHVDLLT